jgi:hypothetical protein
MAETCGDDMPPRQVTVISAMVLRHGRAALGDSPEVFAARAGVSPDLVAGIEDGSRPAWGTPGPQLVSIADALRPVDHEWFWTATACDLLLTNLLSHDDVTAGVAAEEAMGDVARREIARKLLRRAISGAGSAAVPLLPVADRVLLRHRAARLAESNSPDGWVGAELLPLFGDALLTDRADMAPTRAW